MNIEQSKTLHTIAQALLVLAGDNSSAIGQACGMQAKQQSSGQLLGTYEHGATAGGTDRVTEARQTEIEREFSRLVRANESLQHATDLLWKRTNTVTSPPAPSETNKATAIDSCGSQLGNQLQEQALRAEGIAANLRYLAESLAV